MPIAGKSNSLKEALNKIEGFVNSVLKDRDDYVSGRNITQGKNIEAEIRFTNFRISEEAASAWSKFLSNLNDKAPRIPDSRIRQTGDIIRRYEVETSVDTVEYMKSSDQTYRDHSIRVTRRKDLEKFKKGELAPIMRKGHELGVTHDAKLRLKSLEQLGMRAVISEEVSFTKEQFEKLEKEPTGEKMVVRERVSYTNNTGQWRWDITKGSRGPEIELEFLGKIPEKNFRANITLEIYLLLQFLGEGELYETGDAKGVRDFISRALGDEASKNPVNFEPLHFKQILEENLEYDVSIKADGERRFLVLFKGEMWLLNPRLNDAYIEGPAIHKKLYLVNRKAPLAKIFRQKDGKRPDDMILDVELVRDFATRTDHIYFLDLLYYNPSFTKPGNNLGYLGDMIRPHRLDLIKRLTQGTDMVIDRKFFGKYSFPIRFHRKEWMPITGENMKSFFDANKYLLSEEISGHDETPIRRDGLIFTPSDGLDSPSPVLKWKPHNMISIDFHIEDGKCYVNDDSGKLTQFVPTGNFPVQDPRTKQNLTITCDAGEFKYASVVEAVYNPIDARFKAVRARSDKSYPNHIMVAQNIWNDINAPIGEEDMVDYDKTHLREFVSIYNWVEEHVGPKLVVFSQDDIAVRWLTNVYNRPMASKIVRPHIDVTVLVPIDTPGNARVVTRSSGDNSLPFSSTTMFISKSAETAKYTANIVFLTGGEDRDRVFLATYSYLHGHYSGKPRGSEAESLLEGAMRMAYALATKDIIYVEEEVDA